MSLAQMTIIGNLGGKPKLRTTPNDQKVCDFSVAVNSKKRVGGEVEELTQWFKVTVWGKQAESCAQYLDKGTRVYAQGRFELQFWTDDSGTERTTLAITGDNIVFLGDKKDRDNGEGETTGQQSAPADTGRFGKDDDVPF